MASAQSLSDGGARRLNYSPEFLAKLKGDAAKYQNLLKTDPFSAFTQKYRDALYGGYYKGIDGHGFSTISPAAPGENTKEHRVGPTISALDLSKWNGNMLDPYNDIQWGQNKVTNARQNSDDAMKLIDQMFPHLTQRQRDEAAYKVIQQQGHGWSFASNPNDIVRAVAGNLGGISPEWQARLAATDAQMAARGRNALKAAHGYDDAHGDEEWKLPAAFLAAYGGSQLLGGGAAAGSDAGALTNAANNFGWSDAASAGTSAGANADIAGALLPTQPAAGPSWLDVLKNGNPAGGTGITGNGPINTGTILDPNYGQFGASSAGTINQSVGQATGALDAFGNATGALHPGINAMYDFSKGLMSPAVSNAKGTLTLADSLQSPKSFLDTVKDKLTDPKNLQNITKGLMNLAQKPQQTGGQLGGSQISSPLQNFQSNGDGGGFRVNTIKGPETQLSVPNLTSQFAPTWQNLQYANALRK